MRVNEKMRKALSILLCLCMLLQNCPVMAFAATTDNLCEHHPEHTAECGYREGSAGSACTHEHSEDCYAILECLHTCGEECADGCTHECTVENGCITMELDCHHVHGGCGYSEGTAEVPCGHVHNESCGYVEAVAGTPCANAEIDPECDHLGSCGYVAAVEGQPCGHTACDDTCGYAPATEGSPCTHVCEVKVNSADSCYKLLCSHADGGHDDACGYAEAVEAHECHYECAECANSQTSPQTGVTIPEGDAQNQEIATSAPDGDLLAMTEAVCTCGTDDPAIHAVTCAVYVAPENPVCTCAEACGVETQNFWCDVCGFDYTACTGTDTAAAYAEATIIASGDCSAEGSSVQWKYDDTGTLTISGTGAIESYSFSTQCPWNSYRNDIMSLIIEEGVTEIGVANFKQLKNITAVTLPSTMKKIGTNAFSECEQLESVTLNEGLETIGASSAFYNCVSLKTIHLPASLTQLHYNAFAGCALSFTVDEANAVYSAVDGVLFNKDKTAIVQYRLGNTEYSVPQGVTSIGDYAFSYCTSLTSVEIPDSVTSINYAFYGCTGLTSIEIPSSVTSMDGAFYGCTGLTSIEIPSSVTSIDYAFYGCTGLTSIEIPSSVTSINYAFRGCTGLTSIEIPSSVTSINYAFYGCTGLTSIEIPSSVTSIDNAFRGCTGLTSIEIPSSVTSMDGAFYGCTGLTSIEIPSSVTSIDKAFYGCTGLTSVKIPNSVASIDNAFYGCTGLTSVKIPNSVTTINSYTFGYCTGLTSIEIPHSVTMIEPYAFSGCTKLLTVTTSCTPQFSFYDYDWKSDIGRGVSLERKHTYENGICTVCGATCTHTGGEATCTEKAVCTICGASYGELGGHTAEPTYASNAEDSTKHDVTYSCCGTTVTEDHTLDVTTGVCTKCGADASIATVTDGTNTRYAADAATLNQAVTAILETGSRTFTVELPADAEAGMITAIRRAICDTEGVADGSIHLTLKGVTSIPGTTNWDGVAFGPRNAQWDENNVEIVSHEEVTQLASVNLPDVTEIGAQAFYVCSNLTSITAPKVQSIGDWGLQGTAITSIDMPLLKEVGFAAFHSTALTEVSLPSLETAGSALFMDCKQLRTVDLPKLQNLKNQLFDRCTSLVSVNVPAATSMSNEVFCDCSELVSITLSGVTELAYGGFAGCTKLENITLGSVITKVNANLFDGEALSSGITLTLNCGQKNAETLPAAAGTNVEWAGFTWKEVKFAHSYVNGKCTACGEDCAHTGGTATCTTLAVCDICKTAYGELGGHTYNTAGSCTVCGAACPHSNFDPATGNCKDCETSLAIAKIKTGETTTYYQTADDLRTAVLESVDDQTITLLADFEMNNDLDFNADGTENILDLNEYTLTGSSRIDVASGELTITGPGSINIFMTADNEGAKIVVGSGVTLNDTLRSVYGGILDLTGATIPEAGLNVILYSDDSDPTTYNVSDVLLLPADYYFFVDGKAAYTYFVETEGTVLKHTDHSYTYTDNGDGTHKATCTVCGKVEVDNEPHTIENHVCTACGAMEIVVSFNAGDYEWKTGDTLYFCRVSGDNEWEEYAFTATVAGDGTVTWTPDKTLYWDGTGEHKLVVVYPGDTPWAWDRFYVGDDQTTTEKLHEFDLMNAMWSGNPTTDPITLNLKHRLAKVTVNYEIAEGVTVSKAEVYTLTQYLLFDIHTLERKNIAWEEGHDLWINSYHNGNQFTAFVSPDAYAAGGNFIKITLSDGSVREVKMNKAVTFAEGAEYTYKVVITADGTYLTCADECTFEYTDNGDGTHNKVCSECGYVAASENHTLTYTANGNIITESCSANCGYSASLTLKAPANLVYDRTEKAATVEGEIIADYKLTYSADAVIMAGDYTATLTVGDYSVSLAFTIAKADPDVVTPSGLKATYGQTLADVELPGGWAWKNSSASVGSVGSNTFAAIYTPANISNFNTLERDLTVVVAKAMPTVTAPVAADDLVYNGTARTLITAGTATGGTMQYSLDGSNWSETIPTGKDAKTYTVYYKVVGDSNHNDSSVDSVQVTIGKATLIVKADNKTMTTGQELPTFTYTITGFVGGESEDVLTAKPTVVCVADGKTAGTYDITVSGAAADNYEITHVNGALSVVDHQHTWTYTAKDDTITATCNAEGCPDAEQSITISAVGKTYDGTPVTATLTGSIDGVATPEITYTGNTNAGTHTASITIEGETASVKFTIEKATVTVTADAKSKPYGTDNPTLTYTSEGLLGDDALTGALETTATKTSNVGEYDITVGSLANSNYTIDFVGAKLTITKAAAPEIQWPTAAALTYGQKLSDSALTSEDKNGTFAWQDGSIVPTVKNNGYVVVYTPKDTDNYDYTVVELTETIPVTVSKGQATVTAAPTPNTLTHTGEGQYLISAGEANGGTMQYSTDNQTWSTTIPQGTDAGKYTVYYKVVGDENHSDTAVDSIEVTIAKADPVIGTVGCKMPLFDSTDISTVELTRTDMSVDGILILTDSELTAGEGTYNWKFTPEDADNYNTITGTVVLTVTADVLEQIRATGTLEKFSYVYGEPFSIDGMTVTATYTTGATKDVTELVSFDSTLAVGQTSVELTYQGKTCTVTGFTVAKKQLVIDRMAWDIPENAVYSGTAYNATLTGNLPEGVTVTKTGDKATNAGDYTAKAVFSLAEGYSADNYEIVNGADLTAEWSIDKAALTITADSYESVRYGSAAPAFAANYSGFVNGETEAVLGGELVFSCVYDTADVAKRKPGDYPIVPGGLTSNNYEISYVDGNLEVISANLVIVIDDKTVTYGDAAPEYTYHYEGFVYGEDISVMDEPGTVSCAYVPGNAVGTMEIKSDNYGSDDCYFVVNQRIGTLTVEKAPLTITAEDNSITYGDAPAANGVTGTGFVNGESFDDLSGELTYSYNYEQFGNVGTYKITPVGLTSDNYEITFADGTLTVNAKAITVTADAVSKTYGDTDPTLTYTAQGLVNGDELTGELKRAAGENVGSYAIEQNTLTAGNNYSITYTGANLTINAKAITEADVELNGSLTYTGKEQTQPITVTEGITYEVTGNKATNVGTYELTVKGIGNYTGEVKLSWSVKETVAVVTKAPAAKTLTYTGETQELITAGEAEGGTMQYQLNGGAWSASIPTAKDEGTYTVSWKVVGDANHADTEVKSITVTIGDCIHAGNTNRDDADCTTQVTCSVCGDVLVESKAHVWGDWTTTLEPTTTTEGSKERLCTNDGCEAKDTDSIPMLNEVEVPEEIVGGDVSVDNPTPATGDDVTITVTPDTGKEVDEVIVTGKDGKEIPVTDNGDGTYTYEQPDGDVTVEVIIKDTIYTVTWIVDGTTYKTTQYKYGETITAPTDPTKAQSGCTTYTFDKWNGFTSGMTMPDNEGLTFTAVFTEGESHIDENTDHICDRNCGKTDMGKHADGNLDHVCDYGCDVAIGEHKDANKDHACDYGCTESIGTCEDADKDHDCDYGCDKIYGEHTDADKNHICDYGCTESIGTCEDADKDHDCDYGCDKVYGTHEDTDKDHTCDYGCKVAIGTCEDADKDHDCDYGCDKVYGEHADSNKDHICDYGCSESIGNCEDADKDHDCDYGCDKVYGTHEDTDKDHACDYGCSETIGTCEDADKDHDCDYGCDKVYGEHKDTAGDGDHVCDYGCGETLTDCVDVDTDTDHKCDECGAAMPKDGTQVEIPADDTGTITPGAPAEIDGKPIVIDWDGEIWLEDKDSKFLVTYKFNEDADPHKEYPTAMYAWLLKWEGETCKAIRVPELDNFMTYKGTSIRVGHSSDGIRFFTAVPVDTLNQAMKGTLLTGELEGYKLVEMGTLYKWAATGTELTVANGAKSYVYGGSAGSTYRQFSKEGSLSWFTGMLTDLPGDAATLAKDILSCPYAVFENADGDQITLYGGSIQRSIYYVALQNKDTWASGTAYDNYVEKIIATVEAAND